MDVTRRRRRRRLFLIGSMVAGLAALSIVTTATSLALFTDSAVVGGNAFDVGTIDITTSPTTALVSFSGMMPGDTANGTLTVSNAGTAQLRYAMTTNASNADGQALRDQLKLTIKTRGTSCAAFDGTALYNNLALSGGAIGDPASGDQGSDRTLAAPSSEVLCFRVTLPVGTGDAYQGSATAATFTFDAEQTANNP